jgi:hypothetical protein
MHSLNARSSWLGGRAAPSPPNPRGVVRVGAVSPATNGTSLPDGRQPLLNVLQQLSRPAKYFRDVLQGRDAAVGQFGVFRDTAFVGSDAVARSLLAAEERSGIQIGWGPALGAGTPRANAVRVLAAMPGALC